MSFLGKVTVRVSLCIVGKSARHFLPQVLTDYNHGASFEPNEPIALPAATAAAKCFWPTANDVPDDAAKKNSEPGSST